MSRSSVRVSLNCFRNRNIFMEYNAFEIQSVWRQVDDIMKLLGSVFSAVATRKQQRQLQLFVVVRSKVFLCLLDFHLQFDESYHRLDYPR